MGRVPKKLRNLDQDATWSKSKYQGWVYGYSIHLTCNESAFPVAVQVETGSFSESRAIDQKAPIFLEELRPKTVAADNGYANCDRIEEWAEAGITLLTPAKKWTKGEKAQAYHRLITALRVPLGERRREPKTSG